MNDEYTYKTLTQQLLVLTMVHRRLLLVVFGVNLCPTSKQQACKIQAIQYDCVMQRSEAVILIMIVDCDSGRKLVDLRLQSLIVIAYHQRKQRCTNEVKSSLSDASDPNLMEFTIQMQSASIQA